MLLNAQTNCGNLIQNPGFDWNGGGSVENTPDNLNFDNVIHKRVIDGVSDNFCNQWKTLSDTPDILTESGVGGSPCIFMNSHNNNNTPPPVQEGIYQDLTNNLISLNKYIVRFKARQTMADDNAPNPLLFPRLFITFSDEDNIQSQVVFNQNIQENPETNNGVFRQFELCFTASGNWSRVNIRNSLGDILGNSRSGIMFDDLELYSFEDDDINLQVTDVFNNSTQTFCSNSTFNLSETCISSIPGLNLTYQWFEQIGNDFVAIDGADLNTYTTSRTAGTHTFRLQITFDDNCSIQEDVTITVQPNPTVNINESVFNFCNNQTQILTTTASNNVTYQWNTGETTNSISVSQPGFYSVTVTDQNGCIGTASVDATNNWMTLTKTATVGGQNIQNVYSGQTITFQIQICNNTNGTLDNVQLRDVLPINFSVNSLLPAPLQLNNGIITGTFDLAVGCTTFTYSGYYTINFASTVEGIIALNPNIVTLTVNDCNTDANGGPVNAPEACPGNMGTGPIIRFVDTGTPFKTRLNVHRPYMNMTNARFELYYPYFLDATGSSVSGLMSVTNDAQNPVLTNVNTPVDDIYRKLTVDLKMESFDIGTSFGDNPQNTYIGNIIFIDFVTNMALSYENVPLNSYQIFVKSIDNPTVNKVDFTLINQNTGLDDIASPFIQYGLLSIQDPETDHSEAAFAPIIDNCTYKVHVSGTGEGAHRWQFNDTNMPFVPIWAQEFTWEYSQPGTYNIIHDIVKADGTVLTSSQEITITEVAFDYPNGMVISNPSQTITDLNDDGFIRVKGPVFINEGVTYQLNNKTIEFADDLLPDFVDLPQTHSGIVVNKNATLNVNNSNLKSVSVCPASMWQGIQIYGDQLQKNVISEPINGNIRGGKAPLLSNQPLRNGKVNISNSVIQEARIGVATYKVFVPFGQQNLEFGRGELVATNTTFRNNHVSVGFRGRTFVENNSVIKGCTFQNTANLKDLENYPNQGINAYMLLQQVKGVQILANTFTGRTAYPVDQRGIAILSYDAAYSVLSAPISGQQGANYIPNKIDDMSKGIDVYSTGGANKVIRVKDNRFTNTMQGITANGSNFDEISYNTFNVPLGNENINSWGIFLQTSAGYLVTENTFISSAANEYTYATVSRNANLSSSDIYKNNYEGNFGIATQTEGSNNNRLQIDCNNYTGNNTHDWAVLSDNMANQGLCENETPQLAATNVFNNCNDGSDRNIFSMASFIYSSTPGFQPDCTEGISIFTCDVGASFNEVCPQRVTSPCPSCSQLNEISLGNTPPGLERDRLKAEIIRMYAQEGNIPSILDFLIKENLPDDRKIIIPTLIDRKEFDRARNELDKMEIETEDDLDFHNLYGMLAQIGEEERTLIEMTENERSLLKDIARKENETSIAAQSVMANIHLTHYIRVPKKITVMAQRAVAPFNREEYHTDRALSNLDIYPNPNEGSFTLSFDTPKKSLGTLFDISGKAILNFEFDENNSKYSIENIAQGFFTLSVFYADGSNEVKRIFVK
jgi:uncharacterized repeat protein (TIGR01451 family)